MLGPGLHQRPLQGWPLCLTSGLCGGCSTRCKGAALAGWGVGRSAGVGECVHSPRWVCGDHGETQLGHRHSCKAPSAQRTFQMPGLGLCLWDVPVALKVETGEQDLLCQTRGPFARTALAPRSKGTLRLRTRTHWPGAVNCPQEKTGLTRSRHSQA